MTQGLEYTLGADKFTFDARCASNLQSPAQFVEKLSQQGLLRSMEPGASPYYVHERVGSDNNVLNLVKLRTMQPLEAISVTDEALDYNKHNPRIVSRLALLIRDLAIDELPQLRQVPDELSMVGIRGMPASTLRHFTALAATVDAGVAHEFTELYILPGMRPGLTGPGQLRWLWTDARTPQLLAACMKDDIRYYTEHSSLSRDLSYIVRTPPTLFASTLAKSMYRAMVAKRRSSLYKHR